ncbi:MAG TPA: GNAT family N-acetyltransferase [Gemmataceae bacterium]|nr:GNAT family N-acetyltransferase [Gemmataceae bacterium]
MPIRPARVPDEVPAVRDLFRAYAAGLGVDLCFQSFAAELAGLPGAYAPPAGRLLVADAGNELAGCVALRPHGPGVGEMKRLYVRPEFRGRGLGRELINRVMAEAAAAGYRELVLDTLPVMGEAIALYRSAGFVETGAYTFNPVPGALYFRRPLADTTRE